MNLAVVYVLEDDCINGGDGNPENSYGVKIVEWTGLSSDLMGDSGRGQVSTEMIDRLITAYGTPISE